MSIKKDIFHSMLKNRELRFFAVLFIGFLLKYLIYGFCYFPILDDYIQYGGYPLYNNPSFVLFETGTIASRPLASLLDIFLWGSLWNAPHVMLILVSLFHFSSYVIFYYSAKENGICLSPLFAVFYLFFPLGFEGSYWISAASRIIVGLFFCSLALLSLSKYMKTKGLISFLSFFLCAACAFALYEACAVFCFLTCVIVLIINRKIKRSVLPFCTLLLLLVSLLLYMQLAQNIGSMGSRAQDSSFFYIFTQADDFFLQLFEILKSCVVEITLGGFSGGLSLLFSKGAAGVLYIAAVFSVCLFAGRLMAKSTPLPPCRKELLLRLAAGLLLFFAPFAPNMISMPVWITYRTMFIPMLGLYIIFDALFSKAGKKAVQAILLSSLMFIFIISGINEYDTYRRMSQTDRALVRVVCSQLSDDVTEGRCNAIVLLDSVPEIPQVSFYKDHVKSVFYTDWSLTGAVRAELKNMKIKKVTPVFADMTFECSDCFVVDLRKDK